MSRRLHVSIFSSDDFSHRKEGRIVWQEEFTEVKEHWIFWQQGGSDLRFWADESGIVFSHTSGPEDSPSSYRTRLTLDLGGTGRLAHMPESASLTPEGIELRQKTVQVEEDITASQEKALARIAPIQLPASGGKLQTVVLPVTVFTVPAFYPNTRAVAAITFGGARNDTQAVNMDAFLSNNYRQQFHGLGEDSNEPATYREEERILVRATQARNSREALPIHMIQDIGRAADALKNARANERVVALICHGNSSQIGRFDPGLWLTDGDLRSLGQATRDTARVRRRIARARDRLAAAEAAVPRDLAEIRAAQEELESWEVQLPNDAINEMLSAFEETAQKLNDANVKSVELQACGTAGSNEPIPTFEFLGRLKDFLRVPVRGHPETIWCFLRGRVATLWLGDENDMGKPGTHTSSTSLPIPRP